MIRTRTRPSTNCFPCYLIIIIIISILVLLEQCMVKGISVEEDLTLTYKEKVALDNFKKRVLPILTHDYMKQDIYLIRWLRAKNLNVDQARQMLLENLRWRKQNNMDTINDEDWSDLQETYPYTSDTMDKEGRPIGTINIGQWSIRELIITGRIQRYNRYMTKLLEQATQAVIREQGLGKNVTQWKVILNMDGFNVIQHACPVCLPTYLTFVNNYENHYPGYADAIILINTPPAFQVVLDLIRPVLSPPTRKALKIFGADKKQWMEYLDKLVSKEQRRPEYGGTKTD